MNEHPKRFERLCMKLLGRDSRFKEVELFGVDGQGQYGIDAIGLVTATGGSVVQSSKCYPSVRIASQLSDWSTDFLKHLDGHWQGQRVEHFILSTAATNLTSTTLRQQIATERARFQDLGIEFEIWGPEKINDLILGHEDLVRRFLGEVWCQILFGPPPGGAVSAALVAQLAAAQTSLSVAIQEQLAVGLEHLRCGDFAGTEQILAAARMGNTWELLTDEVKAGVLRLSGSLAFQRDDFQAAQAASDAARRLHPTEPRLAARLAAYHHGPAEGLRVLGRPSTTEGRQVEASLLLADGHLPEAERAIERLLAEDTSPETLRLRGSLEVAKDHRAEALRFAVLAEAAAPSWRATIRLASIARYANSLSPSAPKHIALHPNPPPLPLVKQDDASIEMRRLALAGFNKLLEMSGEESPLLPLFRLACLATLPGLEEEAARQCREVLDAFPLCLEAIYWSLSRGYPIDRDAAYLGLETLYSSGQASEEQVRCLALLSIELRGNQSECAATLEASLGKLSPAARTEAEDWIRKFRNQSSEDADEESIEQALKAAELQDDTSLKSLLTSRLRQTPPDIAGYHLAERVADRAWWDLLAPFIEPLASFETPLPIRLAAHVLFATGPASETLAFLEKHASSFVGGQLPPDLLRVQVGCLSNTGDFPQAVRIATLLAAETGRVVDRLNLAQLLAMSGNAQACAPIIRRALSQAELDAEEAFRYSVVLAVEDPALAQKLWRCANAQGIPDSILLPALTHAYRLGLDAECGPLMVRVNARAQDGSGDVWTATVDDMLEQVRSHRQRVEDVMVHLRMGAVPIHSVPSSVVGPLASLYELGSDGEVRTQQRALFLRHGGRPRNLVPKQPWREWQILLDVTGLLIADQLDLLDHIEALDAPTIVSRSLIEVLYGFERDVTHQQIARVQAQKEIISARTKSLLTIVNGDFAEHETVRYAQDRLEVSEAGPTVELLVSRLGGSEVAEDGDKPSSVAVLPQRGGRLVFIHNTLESVGAAGCLAAALEHYRCEISQDTFDEIVLEVESAEAGDKLAKRLRDLRERIAIGLQTGRYVVSARDYFGDQEEAADTPEDAVQRKVSPLEASLFDLIRAPGIKGAYHWCDDRHLTSFSHSNDNTVVGVVEVLNALILDGRLSEEEGRLKFLKLRAGGAVFIPLDPYEVMVPLTAAPIVGEALLETPPLAVLRRNLAAALRQDPYLKIGEGPAFPALKGRPDETIFLTGSQKVLEDCLFQVWADKGASDEVCRARSDWLWSNLRVEQSLRPTPGAETGQGNEVLTAVFFAGILAKLPTLLFGETIRDSWKRQRALMEWFTAAALSPRDHAKRFYERVAEYFCILIKETFDDELDEEDSKAALRLRQVHISMLPEAVQNLVLEDQVLASRIGAEAISVMSIEHEKFDVDSFWSSAVRAWRNGRSTLTSTSGAEVELRRTGTTVVVRGAVSGRLDEPYLDILAATKRSRVPLAKTFLQQLDMTPADREAFSKRLSPSLGDAELVRVLEDATLACPSGHYARLRRHLTTERQIDRAVFMPPRADRLLLHLRLSEANGAIASRLPGAWDNLSNRFGSDEAFRRLGGLPVDLATVLRDRQVNADELVGHGSPVGALHRAALTRRSGSDPSQILKSVWPVEGAAGQLFQTLLEWTAKAFESDQAWWAMNPPERLTVIWTHAHLLTEAIAEVTDQFGIVADLFVKRLPHRDISGVIAERWESERDCSWPDTLNDLALIYHGLNYVYGNQPREKMDSDIRDFVDRDMVARSDTEKLPAFPLLRRSRWANDALGSWLSSSSQNLLPDGIDPEAYRDDLLGRALAELGQHPAHREAWMTVCAVAPPALSPDQQALLGTAFDALSLGGFLSDGEPIAICPAVVSCRIGLGRPLAEEVLAGKLHAFAKACAKVFPGSVTIEDKTSEGGPTKGAETMSTILSMVGEAATGPRGTGSFENLHNAAIAVAHGWPACAGPLRSVLDNLVRQSPPADAHGLWRTFIWLRSWA